MNTPFRIRWLGSISGNRKSRIQNLKSVGSVAFVFTLAMCGAVAEAQQPGRIPTIGMLYPDAKPGVCPDGFRQGMRELGYVDGQNINIDYLSAEGHGERFPALAAAWLIPAASHATALKRSNRIASRSRSGQSLMRPGRWMVSPFSRLRASSIGPSFRPRSRSDTCSR